MHAGSVSDSFAFVGCAQHDRFTHAHSEQESGEGKKQDMKKRNKENIEKEKNTNQKNENNKKRKNIKDLWNSQMYPWGPRSWS